MFNRQLAKYLESQSVNYHWITHPPSFTAQETARRANIPKEKFAKTVIVKLNGKMAMTVMPATEKLSFHRLKKTVGVNDVTLVSEWEFVDKFPGCERGAMPPFGKLYGLPVFVSGTLAEDSDIAFSAGSHREVIKISFKDFKRLERPRIGSFTV